MTLEEASERLAEERQQRLEELGIKPTFQMQSGVNRIEIDPDAKVRIVPTRYGERYVFGLMGEFRNNDFMASPMLAQQIFDNLKQSNRLVIIRTKTNIDGEERTRYNVYPDAPVQKQTKIEDAEDDN